MDSRSLTPIADGPIIDQLNAAWLAAYRTRHSRWFPPR